jgi:hypothetical protein
MKTELLGNKIRVKIGFLEVKKRPRGWKEKSSFRSQYTNSSLTKFI